MLALIELGRWRHRRQVVGIGSVLNGIDTVALWQEKTIT